MSGHCLVASLDWVKILYIISGYYCYVSNSDCPFFMAFVLCRSFCTGFRFRFRFMM